MDTKINQVYLNR